MTEVMPDHPAAYIVRPMAEAELDAVVRLWHVSKRVAYPYLPLEQGRTLAEDDHFFRTRIVPQHDVWVAVDGAELVGFLAISGSYIDRLYVHPDRQRRGAGEALLGKARERSPAGLQLSTHQQNLQARAFYEKHGFRAVRFGISPPPESAPDVIYHWMPADTTPC
jgi:ribosomal protein S18 acetylase RimI-like enzyme